MTNLVDEKRLEDMNCRYRQIKREEWLDLMETFQLLYGVVRAAQSVRDGLEDHIAEEQTAAYSFWKELDKVLAPFSQGEKEKPASIQTFHDDDLKIQTFTSGMVKVQNVSKFGEVCKHGLLLRSCEICELDSQIASLKSENARMRKALEQINLECDDGCEMAKCTPSCACQIAKSALELT